MSYLQKIVLLAAVSSCCSTAFGQLALTPQGVALGFTLTTFATINPGATGCCNVPFGVTVTSNGRVLVFNNADGRTYVFPDVDGQTLATAISSISGSNSSFLAFANSGGKPYGPAPSHFLAQLNDDGTVNHVLTGVPQIIRNGMATNPINKHLIIDSTTGLIDVDPLANGGLGSSRVINAQLGDGVSVSPNGKIVYLAQGLNVNGYDILTGALVITSPNFPSPDGTGVIFSTNPALNGKVIVVDNNGSVYLWDTVANTYFAIASGGARGDYASPDPNNGTIFLDFSDIVARLGCGGCFIGAALPSDTFQVLYAANLDKGDSVVNITNSYKRKFK